MIVWTWPRDKSATMLSIKTRVSPVMQADANVYQPISNLQNAAEGCHKQPISSEPIFAIDMSRAVLITIEGTLLTCIAWMMCRHEYPSEQPIVWEILPSDHLHEAAA